MIPHDGLERPPLRDWLGVLAYQIEAQEALIALRWVDWWHSLRELLGSFG